jgi:hypothetical protein
MERSLCEFLTVFSKRNLKPFLFKSIDTGEESQSGENIAKDLVTVIEEIGVNKVVSLVTDNASNMKNAWKLLRERYPRLIVNGCAAHTIYLLVKDTCKLEPYAEVLQQARLITSFVKDRNALCKRFERLQTSLHEDGDIEHKRSLVFVGETRWYTHHPCTRRVLENKDVLKQLILTSAFKEIKGRKTVQPKKALF